MADNELYRHEIVIEVKDDGAVAKVNKFEQKFRQSMNRVNKLAKGLDGKRIEPIMEVRDKLTSSVLKADRLIKKLDAAHASPVIAAQDRVTNVVTRVNALIDAINRKDAEVVAEMKGPLMDELVKAKKAVADLGDVKTGPVAELKGELFHQLSKAQSIMKNIDRMTVRPKVRIWDMATKNISTIGRGLKSLTSRAWTITVKVAGGALNTIRNIAGTIGRVITSPLTILGVGVGAAGAIAGGVMKPLDLAGDMEQTRIAFETMLGSAQKARSFIRDMEKFAATTPFDFPELQESAKLMMAFGFSAEKILPVLRTIGDTAAGLGAGSEGIQRMVRALGQMQAKGRIQAEELLQLQEVGVPAAQILQEELGLTAKQVGEIGKLGISSGKVIDALLRGMEKRFGGLMNKQSRSLKGLWSNIKDTFQMNVLWRWGEGIRKAVQPRLQAITDWFDKNEKTIEKWGDKLEKISGQASEWVLGKLEKAFKWLDTNFFSNEEFMQLDFQGKIKFVWDTIQKEFDSWWSSSGEKFVTEKAAMIGETLGGGIGSFLMAALGVAEEPDKLANESPFVKAGTAAGAAFLKAFLEAFDAQKIADKAWEAFKRGQKEALKVLPGGEKPTLASWLNLGISAWLFKKLGGFTALKWVGDKAIGPALKWVGGKLGGTKAAKAAAEVAATATTTGASKAGTFASFFRDYRAAYQLAREIGKGPFSSLFEGAKILKQTAPASKTSSFLGKAAIPLGIAISTYNIATSQDKWKTAGKEAGGWAGAIGGGKLGAAAGTAIAPGIGTVIGGIIGSAAGAFGGSRLGSKIVDWVRGTKDVDQYREKTEKTGEAVKNTANKFQHLNNTTVQLAGGYNKVGNSALKTSDLVHHGMNSMTDAVNSTMNNVVNIADITARRLNDPAFAAGYNLGAGLTSGVYAAYSQANYIARWIINQLAFRRSTFGGFGGAVVKNTGPAKARITPYAKGSIVSRPHLAMVAEEGPEAIIPLSPRRRKRALKLWQETGRYLGVEGYAEGGYTSSVLASVQSVKPAGTVVNIYMDGLISSVEINNVGDIQKVANIAAEVVVQQLIEVLENKAS